MKRQKQPSDWSCLPTAFAMILNVDVYDIFKFIGHDGSDIWWPEYAPPWNRRAFHVQEMIDFAVHDCVCSVMCIEAHPVIQSRVDSDSRPVATKPGRMKHYLECFDGVLTGEDKQGRPHAVAWYADMVYDPNGPVYSVQDFQIQYFFAISKSL